MVACHQSPVFLFMFVCVSDRPLLLLLLRSLSSNLPCQQQQQQRAIVRLAVLDMEVRDEFPRAFNSVP